MIFNLTLIYGIFTLIAIVLFIIMLILIFYENDRRLISILNIMIIIFIIAELLIIIGFVSKIIVAYEENHGIINQPLLFYTFSFSKVFFISIFIFLFFMIYKFFEITNTNLHIKSRFKQKSKEFILITIIFAVFLPIYFIFGTIQIPALMSGQWESWLGDEYSYDLSDLFILLILTINLFSVYLYIDSAVLTNKKPKKLFSIIFLFFVSLLAIITSIPTLEKAYVCEISPTCGGELSPAIYFLLASIIPLIVIIFLFIISLNEKSGLFLNKNEVLDKNLNLIQIFLTPQAIASSHNIPSTNATEKVKHYKEDLMKINKNKPFIEKSELNIIIAFYFVGYISNIFFSTYLDLLTDLEMYTSNGPMSLFHTPLKYLFGSLIWPSMFPGFLILLVLVILWYTVKEQIISFIYENKNLIHLLLLFPILIHIFWIIFQVIFTIQNNQDFSFLLRIISFQFLQIEFIFGWNVFFLCYIFYIYLNLKEKISIRKLELILAIFIIMYFLVFISLILFSETLFCDIECRIYP